MANYILSIAILLPVPDESQLAQPKHTPPSQIVQSVLKTARENISRAECHFSKGNWDLAVEDFSAAIRIDPKLSSAYRGRGLANACRHRRDQAIMDLNRAIEIDPRDPINYTYRGRFFADRDEDKAFQDFNKALDLDPYCTEALICRGSLRLHCWDQTLRNEKLGLAEIYKACKIDNWNDSDKLTSLALAYATLGEHKEAVKLMKLAIQNAKRDGKDIPTWWNEKLLEFQSKSKDH